MKTSLAIVAAAAVLLAGVALTDRFGSDEPAGPEPTTPTSDPSLADGEWFGFVTVSRDGDRIVLTFDQAEMLSGEEARLAAIEAGVIGPDEQLPNDFFIDNADERFVEVALHADAEFFVIDGNDLGLEIVTDIEGLESLTAGTYDGPPVYGIAPGVPIPMNVEISDGALTTAHAVYLP